jgi:acyl carrier protein
MNESELDNRFFNFPPETLRLIAEYRKSRDPKMIEPVMRAIVRKYAPERVIDVLDPLRIQNAFGLESLTLLEVVLDLQDAFEITLSDPELQKLQTMEETVALITDKVNALRSADSQKSVSS